MPDKELRQRITDICFENGGVTKPMVDKLEALLSTSQREAEVSLLNELTDSQINSQDLEWSTPGFSHEVIPASVIYDKLKQLTDSKGV